MKSWMAAMVLLLGMVNVGCGPVNPFNSFQVIRGPRIDPPPDDESVPFDPFQLRMRLEPYRIRIDLFIRVWSVLDNGLIDDGIDAYIEPDDSLFFRQDKDMTPAAVYGLYGIDLGNHLFYDSNGNLGLDVVELLAIGNEPRFVIDKERTSRSGRAVSKVEKQEKQLITYDSLSAYPDQWIEFNSGGAVLHCPTLFSKDAKLEILQDENSIESHSSTLGRLGEAEVVREGDTFRVLSLGTSARIRLENEKTIWVGESLCIKNLGKMLEFSVQEKAGKTDRYFLKKSEQAFYWYDAEGRGIVFEKTDTGYRWKKAFAAYSINVEIPPNKRIH